MNNLIWTNILSFINQKEIPNLLYLNKKYHRLTLNSIKILIKNKIYFYELKHLVKSGNAELVEIALNNIGAADFTSIYNDIITQDFNTYKNWVEIGKVLLKHSYYQIGIFMSFILSFADENLINLIPYNSVCSDDAFCFIAQRNENEAFKKLEKIIPQYNKELLIKHIYKNNNIELLNHINHYSNDLYYVCYYGNIEMLKLILTKVNEPDLQRAYEGAYEGSHLHIIEYLQNKFSDFKPDWNVLLEQVSSIASKEFFEFAISKTTNIKWNKINHLLIEHEDLYNKYIKNIREDLFEIACIYGIKHISEYMFLYNKQYINWDILIHKLPFYERFDNIIYLVRYFELDYIIDDILNDADNYKSFELIYEFAYDITPNMIQYALENNNIKLAKYLISMSNNFEINEIDANPQTLFFTQFIKR